MSAWHLAIKVIVACFNLTHCGSSKSTSPQRSSIRHKQLIDTPTSQTYLHLSQPSSNISAYISLTTSLYGIFLTNRPSWEQTSPKRLLSTRSLLSSVSELSRLKAREIANTCMSPRKAIAISTEHHGRVSLFRKLDTGSVSCFKILRTGKSRTLPRSLHPLM
jgi:hypothetical protein